jgi:hypothetical protein
MIKSKKRNVRGELCNAGLHRKEIQVIELNLSSDPIELL